MITWIQQTFQHHFRILFAVLLVVVIISFVATIGAGPGLGGNERKMVEQPYFDLNLGTEEDKRKLFGDASLSVFLLIGYIPPDEGRLQQYALSRYASIALANELKIPAPTSEEMIEHIKTMPRFANETGQFDPKKYAEFQDSLKKDANMNQGDMSRVLADNIRAERVQKLLGGPGFILPAEIKRTLAMTDTSWTLGVASFDYASFNPTIKPTEEEITKYFTENGERYQIPPQVNVSAIDFPAASFVDKVNVSEAEVRAYYDSNPTRFPKGMDDKNLPPSLTPANPTADYALVRPQVELALKLERARNLAGKEASDFAVLLYDRKITFGSPELTNLTAQRNLTVKNIPSFNEGNVPPELGSNPQIGEEAFKLNKQRFLSDALLTQTGSVILVWKETIPAREPALIEVRAKVAADYIEQEKRKRFVEAGRTARTLLAARVKAGEPFEKAAEAVASSQGMKTEAKLHPAFTMRQQPQDLDGAVLNSLETLQQGEVSEMVGASSGKGFLVYAVAKKVPEINDANPQYAEARTQLAQNTAANNASEYLRALVETEQAKSAAVLR